MKLHQTLSAKLALSMVVSSSAFATDAEQIRQAELATRAQVMAQVNEQKAEILRQITEIRNLEKQIERLSAENADRTKSRNISLVISTGLAVTTGIIAFKASRAIWGKSSGMIEMGFGIVGGLVGVGTAAGTVGTGLSAYRQNNRIVLNSNKLSDLREALAGAESNLNKSFAALGK